MTCLCFCVRYDLNTPRGQRTTAKGGQRLITVLIYLSDVEEVREPHRCRLSAAVSRWRRQTVRTIRAARCQSLDCLRTQDAYAHTIPNLSL